MTGICPDERRLYGTLEHGAPDAGYAEYVRSHSYFVVVGGEQDVTFVVDDLEIVR